MPLCSLYDFRWWDFRAEKTTTTKYSTQLTSSCFACTNNYCSFALDEWTNGTNLFRGFVGFVNMAKVLPLTHLCSLNIGLRVSLLILAFHILSSWDYGKIGGDWHLFLPLSLLERAWKAEIGRKTTRWKCDATTECEKYNLRISRFGKRRSNEV